MRQYSRKTAEGIYEYSHLHGLLPGLAFLQGMKPASLTIFMKILAAIAPRPLLIVAPTWDQYASFSDISRCTDEVKKVYGLYKAKKKMELFAPEDYNRFSNEIREKMILWMKENFK